MSSTTIVNTHTTETGDIVAPTAAVDEALQKVVVKASRKKKLKDPNAPKRPMGAYMLWLQDNRASICEEYCSDLSGRQRVTSTASKAGELWNELRDEEKAPFTEKAAALKEVYVEEMKVYKPSATDKAPRVVYDPEDIPEAPEGWTGPFLMHYMKAKVKGVDGKTVRIQKVFTRAVELATDINAAWSIACEEGDIPSYWSSNSKPCNGITKTTTGYDLRFGADVLVTREQDSKGGLASWVFGNYTAPTAETSDSDSVYDAETESESEDSKKPKKAKKAKKTKKPKKTKKSPEADKAAETKKSPEADKAAETKKSPEADKAAETKKSPEADKAAESPEADKAAESPEADKAAETKKPKKAKKANKSPEPETDKAEEVKPSPKKKVVKKMVKKVKKSKYPESELDEIEIEKDGKDVELMMHEDSGEVFEKSNLMEPVGKVDDGEIMFF